MKISLDIPLCDESELEAVILDKLTFGIHIDRLLDHGEIMHAVCLKLMREATLEISHFEYIKFDDIYQEESKYFIKFRKIKTKNHCSIEISQYTFDLVQKLKAQRDEDQTSKS